MSIWTIKETDDAICFVEDESNYHQSWDIIQFMSNDYMHSPVQLPVIACFGAYENCLVWDK